MIYCDAHNHLLNCSPEDFIEKHEYSCCNSFLTEKEFNSFDFDLFSKANVINSFGIHPYEPDLTELKFLKRLIAEEKIQAIGECGFDLYDDKNRATYEKQKLCFEAQLSLALENNFPLIIHNRKASDKLFKYHKEFAKLPSVIFHSFPGNLNEVDFWLDKKVNAYFSFGKTLLRGKKTAIECVTKIDVEKILLETDAPFQPLKGETQGMLSDIEKVYEKACSLRKLNLEDLCICIYNNFKRAFSREKV